MACRLTHALNSHSAAVVTAMVSDATKAFPTHFSFTGVETALGHRTEKKTLSASHDALLLL